MSDQYNKNNEKMSEKLFTECIQNIEELSSPKTKYGIGYVARINFVGKDKKQMTFWVTEKQFENLISLNASLFKHGKGNGYSSKSVEAHIVYKIIEKVEDDGSKTDVAKYVWGGVHTAKKSDLKYMENRWNVKFKSPFIGRIDLEGEKPVEVAEELKDE